MRLMAKVEEKSTGQESLSDERLHELFREMLLIRRFEEKVEERFRAGELPGFLHVAIGQEAVASGVCAALAFQFRKQPRVGVAFFGDGATNTGTFHESLNLAQLWKVPAIFVLEMNAWAESTPMSQHAPIEDFAQRAVAFGMRSIDVDGQDVEAVHAATREAREHAVSGKGPVFLNVRTYRLVGHYIGDPQVYREKSEIEELRETKDPVELLRARLEISAEDFDALDHEIEAVVEEAVTFAKAGTDPPPEDALKYVYA